MAASSEITLEFKPRQRFDLIDVNALLRVQGVDVLERFPRALYCSYHTTAGYLEPHVCSALRHSPTSIERFVRAYKTLYPERAGYRHDNLAERHELTEAQKVDEPLNGDSHLTFFGAGLLNCVTYDARPQEAAFFVDLDGLNGTRPRTRRTTVIGFDREVMAARMRMPLPASEHAIASFNLRDPRLGFFEELQHHVDRLGVAKGRIDLRLLPDDRHAGLTVNEFETLLMTHDLAEVLRNPFRFMARSGWHALRDLGNVPTKLRGYAKYDLVVFVNRVLDALGLRGTAAEHLLDRSIGGAAARYLHTKRSISLPISDHDRDGHGEIVQGTYQSPILVQWRPTPQTRLLDVRLVSFE